MVAGFKVAMQKGTCSKCGTVYLPQQVVCLTCGNLLFDPTSSTVHIRIDPSLLRLRRNRPQGETGSLGKERTIRLQIRGLSERVTFEEGTEVVLGRTDVQQSPGTRLDLTPYGAHERGVSREHAVLRFHDGELTVTDLGSVNGTSLNLKRLTPNQPQRVKDGDEILLGRLSLVIKSDATPPASPGVNDDTLRLPHAQPNAPVQPDDTKPDMPNVSPASVSGGKLKTQQLDDSKVAPPDKD